MNSRSSASLATDADWAHGIPRSRRKAFIATLSRHRRAVAAERPGSPSCSRSHAAVSTKGSSIVSMRAMPSLCGSSRMPASTLSPSKMRSHGK
jgi:hypothetical protein